MAKGKECVTAIQYLAEVILKMSEHTVRNMTTDCEKNGCRTNTMMKTRSGIATLRSKSYKQKVNKWLHFTLMVAP